MESVYNAQLQDFIMNAGCPVWVVKEVQPQRNYTLLITFASGEQKIYNAQPLLEKAIFAPLKDLDFFMKARVVGGSVAWSDEVDVAPEHLYECSLPAMDRNL